MEAAADTAHQTWPVEAAHQTQPAQATADTAHQPRPTQAAAGTAHRARSMKAAADAAAAEDFDPLRIRPYVSLPDPEAPAPDTRYVHGFGGGGASGAEPSDACLDPTGNPTAYPDPTGTSAAPTAPPHPARRRRYVLLGGAGALAAVTAGAVFATGLFSSAADRPTRDRALPGASAADRADPTEPPPPSAKRSGSPTPRTPSATPRGMTPPPAPTRSAPPPSSSTRSPSPSPPPSTARATGSVDATPSRRPTTAATLSHGDKGPGVAELQGRLAQLYLYVGERNGSYTREVTEAVLRYQWARGLTADPPGEYGRQTRRSLESETREP
ncbi:peptidoglycan-binding domain-containing protein [Streptomyces sp. KN37]|uniref:peptidoglycan-binding domain-containing protein n=1 Tax=Streptomyces sp. KN37 TaxID=3090667 RepID=UPI002A766335|nr:peptidoglycan-binding domain-containing protein [Streptomyces sp. KN37]WPO74068.1 peptidoglycan-binding domain-containing protein [Streptomyces sp. KN37]